MTVSQWAEAELRLSAEDSSEPGRYSCDRAPFQRGILDAVSDPTVSEVVIMSSAQVGKTTILKAIIGYYIDQDPSPILCLQPTVEMAETFSKDRLAPMVRDTPALRDKIADPKSRSSGNTMLHKRFPGGHITMAGANSPASLASRPIRVVLMDEVDRYPESAGSEGDPVNLARKRSTTFWNRTICLTSTPTIKGMSRIEQAYESSDQRRLYVPCPHCDQDQELKWKAVHWEPDKPKTAQIACQHCGALWSERDRQQAIRGGEWRAGKSFSGIAGFHLSELYSPWSSPAGMAKAFLDAKHGGTEQLKTWVNTVLGEAWEESGESADNVLLAERVEQIQTVPAEALVLTAGVDIQADRIELEVVGWSEVEESWSIDYQILPGSTTDPEVWADLGDALLTRYPRTAGQTVGISAIAIDSGYLSRTVNQFVHNSTLRNLWSVKGMPGMGRPIVESIQARARRIRKRKSKRTRPEIVGVDEAKLVLMRRLKTVKPGPGFCHFPDSRPAEYFKQLTAEKLVTKYKQGRKIYEWVKTRQRNEALDCRIYAHAALLLLDPDYQKYKPAPVIRDSQPAPKQRRITHRRPMRPRGR